MRLSRKLFTGGLIIVSCCGLSLLYSLTRGDNGGDTGDSLNGQRQAEASLRLESWGDCYHSAPALVLAAAWLQVDHAGRSRLRRDWQKWRVGHGTAQLTFFLRYTEAVNRLATIDEFHANQDVMVDSKLARQDDIAMLQASVAWFLRRCPRTPWLLFAGHGAAVNPRLVSLHATGGLLANGAAIQLPMGLAPSAVPAGNRSSAEAPLLPTFPRCLLLDRAAAERLPRWPTTWSEMVSAKDFNATVRDATRLFCSVDVDRNSN